ncbi:YccS family putative transporter [Vibrio sp. WXL210]|uniref:YccS family putative transporter n=1 Tax=Vibrio sp. WXL210 TaxID=3450709 RepID=UPI003EC8D5D1
MPASTSNLSQQLQRRWTNKTFNYSILMLITLLGAVLPCWYLDQRHLTIPLILGVIAAALSDSDDRFSRRMRAIVLTLICFSMASLSVEWLFPYPPLFVVGLATSCFMFIMLGAIGPRYASIAFGSILMAIYTMLSAYNSPEFGSQPTWLLAGAAWYFLMSTLWQGLAPSQPVQNSTAKVFFCLADYLEVKSQLFQPVSNLTPQPYRLAEAKLNAATVEALNQCKNTLLSRTRHGHIPRRHQRLLNIYFQAQDIHERVSSSHSRYQELAKEFERSDVMFRFKYLLETQARACRQLGDAIQLNARYQHSNESVIALDELQNSIEYLRNANLKQPHPSISPIALAQLGYLFNNLAMVEKQFSSIEHSGSEVRDDEELNDTNPHTLKAMWQRLKANLNRDSILFRHAVRLSVALSLGYGIIQLLDLERGYWIMLTTLFVCQPNYSATRQKLTSRVIGTIAGLLIGVPLLAMFPSQESQLVFIVLSGLLFFAFRINNYSYATTFITLLVLFSFHQLGEGYAVVLPRLSDTLIGCILAVGAVRFILPDWQSKRLAQVMADALHANNDYLTQVIGQYRVGKRDTLNYRISRREAHNQDAALNTTINNMLVEPGRYQENIDDSYRFLTLNHALLSYISAMGAHRKTIENEETHRLVVEAHRFIHQQLERVSAELTAQPSSTTCSESYDASIERRLSEWHTEDESSARMLLEQMHLIYRMMPEMHTLASRFTTLATSPNGQTSES